MKLWGFFGWNLVINNFKREIAAEILHTGLLLFFLFCLNVKAPPACYGEAALVHEMNFDSLK
jgi:hypothetical protein